MRNSIVSSMIVFFGCLIGVSKQQCQTQNTQFNQAYQGSSQPFRMPLSEYFVGYGLQYSILSPNSQTYNMSIEQTSMSKTTSPFSGKPIQTAPISFGGTASTPTQNSIILYQSSNGGFYVTVQSLQYDQSFQFQLNRQNQDILVVNSTSMTCFGVNALQLALSTPTILVSCVNTSNSTLVYYYLTGSNTTFTQYTTSTSLGGTLANLTVSGQTSVSLIPTPTASQIIQFNTVITALNSTTSQIVSSAFSQYTLQGATLSQTNSMVAGNNDSFTGVFSSLNGTVFFLSYQNGLYMIVNGNGISKNPIPIKYGVALGVHEIPLTTTQSEFLIAIPTLNNGIVTSDDLFRTSTILGSQYITQFNTAVSIDGQFIVLTSQKGTEAFPSFFNQYSSSRYPLYSNPTNFTSFMYNSLSHFSLASDNQANWWITLYLNPYLTIGTSKAYNGLINIVAASVQSSASPSVNCSITLNLNQVNNAGGIYQTTNQSSVTVSQFQPFNLQVDGSFYFTGPALTVTVSQNSTSPNVTHTPAQLVNYNGLSNKNLVFSQNFILPSGKLQPSNNFFYQPGSFVGQQLYQVIQTQQANSNIYFVNLLILDPSTGGSTAEFNPGIQTSQQLIQASIGSNSQQELILACLWQNGTVSIFVGDKTTTPAFSITSQDGVVTQVQIVGNSLYVIVNDVTDDDSTLFIYSLATYTEISVPDSIANIDIFQVASNQLAFGSIVFLDSTNSLILGQVIDSQFVVISNNAYSTSMPSLRQLSITQYGIYITTSAGIYYLPTKELFFPGGYPATQIQTVSLPLYSATPIAAPSSAVSLPFLATATLTHFYVAVSIPTSTTTLFMLYIYQSAVSELSTLFYTQQLSAPPLWVSAVGNERNDSFSVVVSGSTNTETNYLLYPSINIQFSNASNYTVLGQSGLPQLQATAQIQAQVNYVNYNTLFTPAVSGIPNKNISNPNNGYLPFTQFDIRQLFNGSISSYTAKSTSPNNFGVYYTPSFSNLTLTDDYSKRVTDQSGKTQVLSSTIWVNTSSNIPLLLLQNTSGVYASPYLYSFTNSSSQQQLDFKLWGSDNSSQICPLIFVDQNSNGPVSVCYYYDSLNQYLPTIVFSSPKQNDLSNEASINYPSTINFTQVIWAEYLLPGLVAMVVNSGNATTNTLLVYTYIRTTSQVANATNVYSVVSSPIQVNMPGISVFSVFSLYSSTFNQLLTQNSAQTLVQGNTSFIALAYTMPQSNILFIKPVSLTYNMTELNQWASQNFTQNTSIVSTVTTTSQQANVTQINVASILEQNNYILSSTSASSLIQAIAAIDNATPSFATVQMPLVIYTNGISYLLQLTFYEYISVSYVDLPCFYQGLYNQNLTVVKTLGKHGSYFIAYQNVSAQANSDGSVGTVSTLVVSYGEYYTLCTKGNMLTAIGEWYVNPTDFNQSNYSTPAISLSYSNITLPTVVVSSLNNLTVLQTSPYVYTLLQAQGSQTSLINQTQPLTVNFTAFQQTLFPNGSYTPSNLTVQVDFTYINPYISEKGAENQYTDSEAKWITGGIFAVIVFSAVGFLFFKSRSGPSADYQNV